MERQLKTDIGLNCFYCNMQDLIIRHADDPEIPLTRRATIDHIKPVSNGGSKTNQSNWLVACQKCNSDRGNRKFHKYCRKLGINI